MGVGLLGVVVPPHTLGKPPPGRQHRHHHPQTIRPRPTGECGALWGGGDTECHNTGVSGADIHTHTHTASIVLNLLVSLFGWLMVTDRHTHRIVTLAVHAR